MENGVKNMLRKDSRFRFRYLESKKDSEESDLETDADICCLLFTNVKFAPSKKVKVNYGDYFKILNDSRRQVRK